MGRVPAEGDHLEIGEWTLKVEEVRGRRIGNIRARKTLPVNLEENEQTSKP
jgi:CBS domain containing-hemolysin-like protein